MNTRVIIKTPGIQGPPGPDFRPYATRAELVAVIGTIPAHVTVAGWRGSDGQVYTVTRQTAATAIADMPGWVPNGPAEPQHFGATGGGAANDGPAFAAALAAAAHVVVPEGTYLIDSPVSVPAGRTLELRGGAVMLWGPSLAPDAVMFLCQGAGLGSSSTATANITKGALTIAVADGSVFARGDFIRLKSAEYFIGIDGVSGYGVRTKGEFAQVVSVSGNTLTLSEAVRDSYNNTAHTVTVAIAAFANSFDVSGGTWRGIGSARTGSPGPGQGGFIGMRWGRSLRVSGATFENFTNDAVTVENSIGANVSGCRFFGPDPADASNGNMPSTRWAKGLYFLSSERGVFSGNTGTHLRRPFDVTTTNASVIARDVVMTGNKTEQCSQMVGVHQCENAVITDNAGSANEFCVFRGRDMVLANNVCDVLSTSSEFGVRIGSAPDNTAYSENSDAGDLVIIGNSISGAASRGLDLRCDVSSMIVKGNRFPRSIVGFRATGKVLRSTIIEGNVFEGAATYDSSSVAVAITNFENVPREVCDGLTILGNQFRGEFRRGVFVPGTMSGTGARRVRVESNSFDKMRERVVHCIALSPFNYGLNGEIAEPFIVRGNTVSDTSDFSPNLAYIPPTNGGYMFAEEDPRDGKVHIVDRQKAVAAPFEASRTYLRGAVTLYTDPSTAGWAGQICTASGTRGNLSGVTGDITGGSPTLTVSSAAAISVGSFLAVAGAGLSANARVIAKAGTALTLSEDAVSTVSGASVTRTAPTFMNFALAGSGLTATSSDATAGKVLKTGDFGLGATSSPDLADLDLDNPLPGGIYRVGSSAVNSPVSTSGGAVFAGGWDSVNHFKLLVDGGGASGSVPPDLWLQARNFNTLKAWVRVIHTHNLLGTVSQAAGVPTGAVIQRGSNSDGEFVRFADGTQICTSSMAADSAGAATWTFPQAFAAAPRVHGAAEATVSSVLCLDGAPGTTSCQFSARDSANARRADPVHLTAIGRWF